MKRKNSPSQENEIISSALSGHEGAIFSSIHEGVFFRDLTGKIIQFNDMALKILDVTAEELLGTRALPESWDAFREDGSGYPAEDFPSNRVLSTGKSQFNNVIGLTRKDKTRTWILMDAIPIQDPDSKKLVRVMCTVQDITAWKRQEAEQASLAEFRKSILDGTNYSIIATDSKGLITVFNSAAEKILGYQAEEMIGKKTPVVLHDFFEALERNQDLQMDSQGESPRDDIGFLTLIAKAARFGKDEGEWTYVKKDGSRLPVFLSITTLLDKFGNIKGSLHIARDITEETKLRKIVDEQRATIVQAARMVSLGEMAAGVAHEINNPLAIIYGKINRISRLLKSGSEQNGNILVDLEKLKTTAERIAQIVKGMQTFSRSTDAAEPFVATPAYEIVSEAIKMCSVLFQTRGIDLRIKCNSQILLTTRGSQLSQVLLSLLGNAADAVALLPEKWVQIVVKESAQGMVEMSVTDSGTGISEKVAQKLMQPFFTTKEIGKGMGLGLSIAKGIIEDHGGKIFLDKDYKHTRFVIELRQARQSSSAA